MLTSKLPNLYYIGGNPSGRTDVSPTHGVGAIRASFIETVAKVNSLTILLARLSRLCRKNEAQGAEGEG